jgi:hypothetical protein
VKSAVRQLPLAGARKAGLQCVGIRARHEDAEVDAEDAATDPRLRRGRRYSHVGTTVKAEHGPSRDDMAADATGPAIEVRILARQPLEEPCCGFLHRVHRVFAERGLRGSSQAWRRSPPSLPVASIPWGFKRTRWRTLSGRGLSTACAHRTPAPTTNSGSPGWSRKGQPATGTNGRKPCAEEARRTGPPPPMPHGYPRQSNAFVNVEGPPTMGSRSLLSFRSMVSVVPGAGRTV